MLTEDEEKYLAQIPADKKVILEPYDPKTPNITEKYVKKINNAEPNLEVIHIGASALGISGQGDIDLFILCPRNSFSKYRLSLIKELGKPISGISLTQWHFEEDSHDIEIYLADPIEESTARQIRVHKILSSNPNLLKKYELLKESVANDSYREYQCQKYEFYNQILK
ncbi:MAG: hypothetical protein US31_C0001G0020 [Berkelbacteria bacterium GW2011_GWA1_36_9]|uniref:Polymerase nucleotidyl transferase domain-containing protein n=1 Tax=Berkelbacteria bacterium GW2011_GWA1_36_9 TaxID=1618331 RepID=A0A0G0FIG7_9BACT|nr:MAG: hypothetical protein US31_C0001G0020 [Berkelbacteria bacterium GW2011_GWA1_36_9]